MKYNWKDLLVDAAIVSVVIGLLALIVGSFPATFSKFLSFLECAWISTITCFFILLLYEGHFLLFNRKEINKRMIPILASFT